MLSVFWLVQQVTLLLYLVLCFSLPFSPSSPLSLSLSLSLSPSLSLSLSVSLRIIHENGFTRDECKQYRPVVYSNTIQSLAAVIRGMDLLGLNFADPARRVSYHLPLLIRLKSWTLGWICTTHCSSTTKIHFTLCA